MKSLYRFIACLTIIITFLSCGYFNIDKSLDDSKDVKTIVELPDSVKKKIIKQDSLMTGIVNNLDTLTNVLNDIKRENTESKKKIEALESPKNKWAYITLAAIFLAIISLIFTLNKSRRSRINKIVKKYLDNSERINMLQKNQMGQKANDFSFEDKAGLQHRLYDIDAPLILLIFNNPDCSLCQQAEELIEGDDVIEKICRTGILRIVAITPDADYDEWMRHQYPDNWIVGYDKEKIIYSQRLYDIQRLPCMYLLGRNKKVLLKEADYERTHKYLSAESRTIMN